MATLLMTAGRHGGLGDVFANALARAFARNTINAIFHIAGPIALIAGAVTATVVLIRRARRKNDA